MKIFNIIKNKYSFLPVLVTGLIILFIYLLTTARTVMFIDAGELTVCGLTLSIPHPTGYPLYILISRFFQIISPLNPAFTSNLISALFASGGAVSIMLLVRKSSGYFPAFFTGLCFAFHPVIWDIATETEVYALSAFLLGLFLLLALSSRGKSFLIIFYLAGLLLTNHLLVIGAVFPIFIWKLWEYRKERNRGNIILAMALFFLGLSPYLVIIIRSSLSPPLNWGGINRGFNYFLWHVSGKQYHVWMFSDGLTGIFTNLKNLLSLLLGNLFLPLALFSIFGFLYIYRTQRRNFFILLILIIFNLAYTSLYKIPDISSYLIPSVVVLAITSGYGVHWLSQKFSFRHFSWLCLSLVLIPLIFYFPRNDKHDFHLSYQYPKSILSFLPESSVYLVNAPGSMSWDEVSPMLYLQLVENYRTDILVIDKELLRRSWYVQALNRQNPELAEFWAVEIADYLGHLEAWENNQPVDIAKLQAGFQNLIFSIIKYGQSRGGIFVSRPSSRMYTDYPDPDLAYWIPENIIPYGFMFTDAASLTSGQLNKERERWEEISFDEVPSPLYRHHTRVKMVTDYVKQGVWRIVFREAQYNQGILDSSLIHLVDIITGLEPGDSLARNIKTRIQTQSIQIR